VVCKKFLAEDEWDVCADCLEGLPMTYQWDIVQNAAFERLARRFEVQDAASLFFFRTESDYRNILYGIKYGNRRRLAVRMGERLGRQLAANRMFRGCQAVVPVPLHPLRRWKRGYNQAELIAQGVAQAMELPVETKLLKRRRNTKTQTKLHGAAKTKNVQGAFAVDMRRAADLQQQGLCHLLLIDDTLTTGSTLAACAAPLLAAGFRISCATLAFAGS
jgi:ComF family protein